MASLIETVRSKFLHPLRLVRPAGGWKVLVVDEYSQQLLGSVLKQNDILQEQIPMIESIANHRERQQDMEALYLLMPTTDNVDRIIGDFPTGIIELGNKARQPMYADRHTDYYYKAAHVFFVDAPSAPLMEKLNTSLYNRSEELHWLKNLKGEMYEEDYILKTYPALFADFWATETQTFSLRTPELFFELYSPPRREARARERLELSLRFASKRIANVCITLNEYPYIRYYKPLNHGPLGSLKPNEPTQAQPPLESGPRWRTNLARGSEARAQEAVGNDHATKLLAFMVQQALDEHKANNRDFGTERVRGTLFITDRSMDMLGPFIHEFTYQAMSNDLLPIVDGTKYTYKFQSSIGAYEDKTATLSDHDTVWTGVRHMHMREAIDKLMADFNTFIQENAVFKGDGAANLNDMKDMLANLPQYQEQREKFSLHLNMAEECMNIFDRDKLPLVANVEQNCATGLTAEGKTPKTLVEEMVPLLDSRDVINANKVRIIALYIQHRDGVPEEDRRRLYQHARLSLPEQDAVNAIEHLGVRLSRKPNDRDTRKMKQKPKDDEYELSRFKPLLRTVIEDHVANKLDTSLFPYVADTPAPAAASLRTQQAPTTSLRSSKPSWHKAPPRSGASSTKRERIIVFVAGGMTYSEIREAYDLSSSVGKDIYIGSTHTLTPRQFIDDLKTLDLGGVGSKALPGGTEKASGVQKSFQDYYDSKYPTHPPPAQRPTLDTLPPPRGERGKTPQPSPGPSFSESTASTTSLTREAKKKKKFFNF